MKKAIVMALMALTLTACGGVPGADSDLGALYTGDESGSWYHFSHNCSAQLCPPN
jgi:hypothetical protein